QVGLPAGSASGTPGAGALQAESRFEGPVGLLIAAQLPQQQAEMNVTIDVGRIEPDRLLVLLDSVGIAPGTLELQRLDVVHRRRSNHRTAPLAVSLSDAGRPRTGSWRMRLRPGAESVWPASQPGACGRRD